MDEVEGQRGGLFLKSAEVASIAGINVEDVVLGKTANDVTTKLMWSDCVCPSVFFNVHGAIAQWFEVCLVLCCRFEPLPVELP